MSDLAEKAYSKWTSRRFLVAIWAMLVSTLLMGYSVVTNTSPDWLGVAMPILLAIPPAYIAAESYTKPKMKE